MKFIANGSISQSVSLSKQKKLDKTLARVCQLLERYSANFLALFPDFCIIFEYFHSRPLHRRVIFFCNFSCSRFFTKPLFPFINYFLVCSGKLLLFYPSVENFSFDIYLQFLKVDRYSNFLSEFCSLNFICGFNLLPL